MVTSEAPGPSEYTRQPDPAFVHPIAWEAVQKPTLLPAHKLAAKSDWSRAASIRVQRDRATKLAASLVLAGPEGSAASTAEGDLVGGGESAAASSGARSGGGSSARSGEEGPAGASAVAVGNPNDNRREMRRHTSVVLVVEYPEDAEEEEEEEDDDGWSGDEGSGESDAEADQKKSLVAADGGMEVNMGSQQWSLSELERLWLQYDNNNSGQISFAEIEKVVVEQYPEFDNKEVSPLSVAT